VYRTSKAQRALTVTLKPNISSDYSDCARVAIVAIRDRSEGGITSAGVVWIYVSAHVINEVS